MRKFHWLMLSACCLCAQAAWADLPYAEGGATTLDLGRYETHFAFPADAKAHVGRYGVSFSQPVAEDVSFLLHGGYLTLDLPDDPVTAPLGYSGRYLGLGGRYQGSREDYLNFMAEITYTWHDVSGNSANQQSEVIWYETRMLAGPVLRLGRWRLMGGGYWRRYTGDETDAGSVTRHLDLSQISSTGAWLGIGWYVERDGSVSLYGTSGADRGVKLVFTREFD